MTKLLFLGLSLVCFMLMGDAVARVELKQRDFQKQLARYATQTLLVYFHSSSNCSICQTYAAFVERLDSTVQQEKLVIGWCDVDDFDDMQILRGHGVSHIPVIRTFREHLSREYGGTMTYGGLMTYIHKGDITRSKVITVESRDQASALAAEYEDQNQILVVGYVPNGEDSVEYKEYLKMARVLQDEMTFAVTTQTNIARRYKIDKSNAGLSVMYPGGKTIKLPSMSWKVSTMVEWIDTLRHVHVPTIDHFNVFRVTHARTLMIGFLDMTQETRQRTSFVSTMRQLARTPHAPGRKVNGFAFMTAGKDTEYFSRVGLPNQTLPLVAIVDADKNRHYIFNHSSQEWNVENGLKFIEQFDANEVPYSRRSAIAVPRSENLQRDIIEVTAEEWSEMVMDSKKHVVVLFYSPWCVECEDVRTLLQVVMSSFSKEHYVFAQLDLSTNDVPVESVEYSPAEVALFSLKDKTKPVSLNASSTSYEKLLQAITSEH